MEFRILGPFEVLEEGRSVELGAAKQKALLAMLLLHANRVVASDRLIDALWEDEPPETAPKALQVYVSQLRKTVGRERLETKAPGYLLRVAPEELDVDRFRALTEQGKLTEALSLWRGPPLSDFEDLSPARVSGRIRLEEVSGSGLPDRGLWRASFVVADMNGDRIPDIVAPPSRLGDARLKVWIGDG